MKDRRKNILNFSERKTALLLREIVTNHDCPIKEKIRLADALDIEGSNLTRQEYGFALKSHFDFVISRAVDTKALFAVEFDGPYHTYNANAQRRDALKDSVCSKLGMPLLRVDSDFIHQNVGRFHLLAYFIDMWFLGESFYEQQAEGHIPKDEDFDPYSVIKYEDGKIRRVFDSAQEAREFIYSLKDKGITKRQQPITISGTDKSGRYEVCLAMLYVRNGTLLSTGCFKGVEFGYVSAMDIAEDIAIISLAKNVDQYVKKKTRPLTYKDVEKQFNKWKYPVEWGIYEDENGLPCFRFTNLSKSYEKPTAK